MKINPTLSRDAVYPQKRFLWGTAKKIIMTIKLVFESKFDGRLLLSDFYFDSVLHWPLFQFCFVFELFASRLFHIFRNIIV